MKFPIPDEALASHIAVLGKTGSGKTTTSKGIIEHVVPQGYRVCILDPIKSDWWGITSSADGKRAGLPFTILGGPRGHVPLHATSGKVLAELVGKGTLPHSILDMANFRPGEHQRFFADFAEALMKKARGVLYLVLEEAHFFAPKERAGITGENMAIYWAKMLATAGRGKGIRLIVLTQRTQALHNALLGSCETMIVHRITAPADQEPVQKWLKANVSDKDLIKRIDSEMSSLTTGTAWLCSGEAKVFDLVQFPRIKTFDNSATPEKDGGAIDVKTAAVDQDKLRAIIGDAVAEADASDPARLKARIAELERAASKPATPTAPAVNVAALEKAAFIRGAQKGEAVGELNVVVEVEKIINRFRSARPPTIGIQDDAPAPTPRAKPVAAAAPPRSNGATPKAEGIGSGHLRILEALLFWESLGISSPTRDQVAAAAGMTAGGGTFKTYAGKLISSGYAHAPATGQMQITAAGGQLAPSIDTSKSARDRVGTIIGSGHAKILDAMPSTGLSISRSDLAEAAGFDANGGTFKTYIGRMVSLGIIRSTGVGQVAVEPWVWS